MATQQTDNKRRVDGSTAPSCYPCRLVRSKRKTLAIEVRPGQEVIVRAPHRMPRHQIDQFIKSKQHWINKHWHKARRPRP